MIKVSQSKIFAKVEIDHPVFRDGSIGEKVAFIGLSLYAWPTSEKGNQRKFKLKQTALADAIGIHRNNVRKSLAGLKVKGVITTNQDHPRASTEYTIQRKDIGGKYGLIPIEVLSHPDVNATAKLIYLALSSVVNVNTGLALLSWNDMSKMVGISRRRIPEAIKQLTETKFAIPVLAGGNTGDIYQLKLVNDKYAF